VSVVTRLRAPFPALLYRALCLPVSIWVGLSASIFPSDISTLPPAFVPLILLSGLHNRLSPSCLSVG